MKNFKIFILIFIFVSALFASTNTRIGTIKNYPNPFNPQIKATTIEYELSEASDVTLEIYDLAWRIVRKWQFKKQEKGGEKGLNQVTWDGRDSRNCIVAEGPYIGILTLIGPKGVRLNHVERKTIKIAVTVR